MPMSYRPMLRPAFWDHTDVAAGPYKHLFNFRRMWKSAVLLTAVVALNIFSFMSASIMVKLGAIDVAFTEAVVGAGAVGVINILAILLTSRKSAD